MEPVVHRILFFQIFHGKRFAPNLSLALVLIFLTGTFAACDAGKGWYPKEGAEMEWIPYFDSPEAGKSGPGRCFSTDAGRLAQNVIPGQEAEQGLEPWRCFVPNTIRIARMVRRIRSMN
jgi:hypothetical protein